MTIAELIFITVFSLGFISYFIFSLVRYLRLKRVAKKDVITIWFYNHRYPPIEYLTPLQGFGIRLFLLSSLLIIFISIVLFGGQK